MYEFLKNIANANDWIFEYGRPDYLNVADDIEVDKTYLFLEPIQIDSKFSDSGNEIKSYSGKFMLLLSSDIDEDYLTKYENYIKPLIDDSLMKIKDSFACSDFQINSFKTLEVVNLFDGNVDGLLVNYQAELID